MQRIVVLGRKSGFEHWVKSRFPRSANERKTRNNEPALPRQSFESWTKSWVSNLAHTFRSKLTNEAGRLRTSFKQFFSMWWLRTIAAVRKNDFLVREWTFLRILSFPFMSDRLLADASVWHGLNHNSLLHARRPLFRQRSSSSHINRKNWATIQCTQLHARRRRLRSSREARSPSHWLCDCQNLTPAASRYWKIRGRGRHCDAV